MKTVLKITWRSNLCQILTLCNHTLFSWSMPETKPKREEDNHSFSVSVPRLGRRLQPPGHGHAGCRRRLSPRPDAVPLPLCTDTAAFSRGVTAAMVSLHALQLCHRGIWCKEDLRTTDSRFTVKPTDLVPGACRRLSGESS